MHTYCINLSSFFPGSPAAPDDDLLDLLDQAVAGWLIAENLDWLPRKITHGNPLTLYYHYVKIYDGRPREFLSGARFWIVGKRAVLAFPHARAKERLQQPTLNGVTFFSLHLLHVVLSGRFCFWGDVLSNVWLSTEAGEGIREVQ